ncbi:hypothetical protein DSC45_12360 [Streptomyces sp. YIM 130001]|nr:hypothetical protein [Streptomyces sp. YIM 130001]RII17686.1 hypothetical protein DSC45_12360 [Streptomyces sp. YIM 130001]
MGADEFFAPLLSSSMQLLPGNLAYVPVVTEDGLTAGARKALVRA